MFHLLVTHYLNYWLSYILETISIFLVISCTTTALAIVLTINSVYKCHIPFQLHLLQPTDNISFLIYTSNLFQCRSHSQFSLKCPYYSLQKFIDSISNIQRLLVSKDNLLNSFHFR